MLKRIIIACRGNYMTTKFEENDTEWKTPEIFNWR